MSLLIKQKQERPKCAYCKDLLSANVYICDGCQTYYHTDCLSELGKCAILGCDKPFTGSIQNIETETTKSKRRGPELSPRLKSVIKGEKAFSGMSLGEKAEASITVGLAVFCFIAFCYITVYGLLWGFPF